jgi:hypothetical protein
VTFKNQCCINLVNGTDAGIEYLTFYKHRQLERVVRVEMALFHYRLRYHTEGIEFSVLKRWLLPSDKETEVMAIINSLLDAGWTLRTHSVNHRRLWKMTGSR